MKTIKIWIFALMLATIFLACTKDSYYPNDWDVPPYIQNVNILDSCLMDGQPVLPDRVYDFGFQMNSTHSPYYNQDDYELSRLVIRFNGGVICDTSISGTEFIYRGRVLTQGISGEAEITANVVDRRCCRGKSSIKMYVTDVKSLPYTQDFSSSFGTFFPIDITGPQSWKMAGDADNLHLLPWTVSNGSVIMTNYYFDDYNYGAVTTTPNIDWLVSSPVSIMGVTNAKMVITYRDGGFADINRAVTIWARKDAAGETPSLTSWTQLPVTLVESDSEFVTAAISLSQFVGSTIWLAVKVDVDDDNLSSFAGIEIKSITIEEGTVE